MGERIEFNPLVAFGLGVLLALLVGNAWGERQADDRDAKDRAVFIEALAEINQANSVLRKNPLKSDYWGASEALSSALDNRLPEPARTEYRRLREAYRTQHFAEQAVAEAEHEEELRQRRLPVSERSDYPPQCGIPGNQGGFSRALLMACATRDQAFTNVAQTEAWWAITGQFKFCARDSEICLDALYGKDRKQ